MRSKTDQEVGAVRPYWFLVEGRTAHCEVIGLLDLCSGTLKLLLDHILANLRLVKLQAIALLDFCTEALGNVLSRLSEHDSHLEQCDFFDSAIELPD